MKFSMLFAAIAALTVTGCFTVSETEAPPAPGFGMMPAATNVSVQVRGFQTTLTSYVNISGYQSVYAPHVYYGPYGYHYGGVHTAYTSVTVPRECASDMFLEQAKNRFEAMGFILMAQQPDYIVETRFTGPYSSEGDTLSSVLWMLCSLFTCDRNAQTWQATLKIYSNRTGRLVFTHDYSQRYEVMGFSPIPLLGVSAYERTASNYMHCWCLTVLTDRVAREAADFLASRR